MNIEIPQLIVGIIAGIIIGISKTGMPGGGIMVVPMLAWAFGGRESVGIMLPMLIFADVFAVYWYKQHAHWDKLYKIFPWVVAGLIVGAFALWYVGESGSKKDIMSQVIGILVILMLVVRLARGKFGDKITPTSKIGVGITGLSAGFTTMVSNAAGPIMTIYLSALKMTKESFIGTIAWYFLIINVAKVPFFLILTAMNPQKPMMTWEGFKIDLILFPSIFVGVWLGKWMLKKVSQRIYDDVVLILAALAAIKLIFS
jgi:uncharacterized protein